MDMAKTSHITMIPQFEGFREQVETWAKGRGVTRTEWYHAGAMLLASLSQDQQRRVISAYMDARREAGRDLVLASELIKQAFADVLASHARPAEAKMPDSSLADALDSGQQRKTHGKKVAG